MIKKIKNIFILILFIFPIILSMVNFCLAADRSVESPYPNIPGATTPTVITKDLLPNYVEYVFNLTVAISGLIAFGVLIIAGVRFMTSGGDVSTMKDAKEQIFSAFLGLLILLCAWIILNTINPQLVQLELPTIK